MLETPLRRKIVTGLKETYPEGLWYKIHGGPMQEKGIPDIIGCIQGRFIGLEVKRPGKDYKEPTAYQAKQLRDIKKAGGISGVVTSVDEALRLISENLKTRKIRS